MSLEVLYFFRFFVFVSVVSKKTVDTAQEVVMFRSYKYYLFYLNNIGFSPRRTLMFLNENDKIKEIENEQIEL